MPFSKRERLLAEEPPRVECPSTFVFSSARAFFFHSATVNTPAMTAKRVGKGSRYASCVRDSCGEYLNGSKA